MKAAFYERTGPAHEVLQVGEVPDERPGPGEVRVKVLFSGVNPSDVKSRAGLRSSAMPFPRVIPHSDGSGVIDDVGQGVSASRIGDRVWIWNAAWGRPFGTAAEYVVLPEAQAVPIPPGVSDEAAACFGIPALTALHAVLCTGGVENKTVLVAGGAGAVGHYAVQFARRFGAAQVIATVSSEAKAALALEAGADVVVDYKRQNVLQAVHAATNDLGVDRIIEVDVAANSTLDLELVRPNGEWVVYGSGAPQVGLPFFPMIVKNLKLQFFIVYNLSAPDRARALDVMAQEAAVLKHNVAATLPLERIADAHEMVAQGKAAGNVVLAVG
ncbi:NADPH:quinone reductase [Ramlibacter albus]|uniref:NADPH:quinone reductase n=1 Tax=Ramlibacter albus TaxID=2079448 RepID=A0A923M4G1_9BURK|nr:NADPH:quinone reductase [Ramlibacter albus]MBC5763210.1 NADPH:quinone reductase [Ramlibacter albus]